MSKQELWLLRRQITWGSRKASGYANDMGLDPERVKRFFEGFYAFIRRKAKKNPYCKEPIDAKVWYDLPVQLWEYQQRCKSPLCE